MRFKKRNLTFASAVVATLVLGCGKSSDKKGNDDNPGDSSGNPATVNPDGSTAQGGGPQENPPALAVPGSGRYIFYATQNPSALYQFDKVTHESKAIVSNYRLAGVAAPQAADLYTLDHNAHTLKVLDPKSIWYVTPDNQLFRYDSEAGVTTPITAIPPADACDQFSSYDGLVKFSYKKDSCKVDYVINLFSGKIEKSADQSEFAVTRDAAGKISGQIHYAQDRGSKATYTDAQGVAKPITLPMAPAGSYTIHVKRVLDVGPDLMALVFLEGVGKPQGFAYRLRIPKSTGAYEIEWNEMYSRLGSVYSQGARTFIELWKGDTEKAPKIYYENLADTSDSRLITGAIGLAQTTEPEQKATLLYANKIQIYDLSKSGKLQNTLIHESNLENVVKGAASNDTVNISYQGGLKLARIDLNTFAETALDNAQFILTVEPNTWDVEYFGNDPVEIRKTIHGKDFYVSGINKDTQASVGMQGGKVGFYDEAAKSLVDIGTIQNKVSQISDGVTYSGFYLTSAALIDGGSELLWIDTSTNTMGESPAPGAITVLHLPEDDVANRN